MSRSDFDPSRLDQSRIRFAEQNGIAQFDSVAREFLAAVLSLDYDETMLTDESSLGDLRGWLESREQFDAWERKILRRARTRQ